MTARLGKVMPDIDWRLGCRWLPIVGLLALYLPTFIEAMAHLWDGEENGHGPLILMVVVWLFWQARSKLAATHKRPASVSGALILALGLFVYIVGRSQSIWLLDIGSLMPLIAGTLLLIYGWDALRVLWFPILFIAFMVPLPAPLVDALTGPLKQMVSIAAEEFLYLFGYPIARMGVMLSIGQYQLLVADACSGLHSMFSLSALGSLYLYMMARKSRLRNAVILLSIIPIAILANILRVIVLVLVTYYFGEAAGHGFLHGFAGMVLFIAALFLLVGIDTTLGFVGKWIASGTRGKT